MDHHRPGAFYVEWPVDSQLFLARCAVIWVAIFLALEPCLAQASFDTSTSTPKPRGIRSRVVRVVSHELMAYGTPGLPSLSRLANVGAVSRNFEAEDPRDDEGGKRVGAPGRRELLVSAIIIELPQPDFRAARRAYSDAAMVDLRQRAELFVYREASAPIDEQLFVIPMAGDLPDAQQLICKQKLRVLAALIEHRLPALFPRLQLRRTKFGLERIRRSDDLIDLALRRAGLKRPLMLNDFHKHHRTQFQVRREFVAGKGSLLLMTVEFRREFDVHGTAADLLSQGFRLDGITLVPIEGEEDGVGEVVSIRDGQLVVEGRRGRQNLDPQQYRVEPSSQTFSLLLPQALGPRELARYETAEWAIQAEHLAGEGYVRRLMEVGRFFASAGRLQVSRDFSIRFGEVLTATFSGRDPSAVALPMPRYCFSADRTAVDTLPFRGLESHGPFDQRRFEKKEPRLLVVFPEEAREEVRQFLTRFEEGLANEGRQRFARGFKETYKLSKIIPQFVGIRLSGPTTQDIGTEYVRALEANFDPATKPDLAIVIVRDEDAFIEQGNPYLAAKAYLISQGIPSQDVRLSKVRAPLGNLQYILEDIAVASYAKMGGQPWTLVHTQSRTAELILGMAYTELGDRFERQRYMGITTVFTSDGTYLLSASSPRCRYEDYPEKLARCVREILSRLVEQYGWGSRDMVRLVFHSSKPLTKHDMDVVAQTAVEELGDKVQLETAFLKIMRDHPFKVVAPGAPGRKAVVELATGGVGFALVGQCVPERGVIINLGHSKRLVCVHGTTLAKREGEGIPQPLLVELHQKSTFRDIAALACQVFHLTGLSWAAMKPTSEPVTIHYARLIAKMLTRLDKHPAWSDRLLDTHLKGSRWFL